MNWTSFHSRGAVLRTVIATADARRDGILPMEVTGVAETFGDELTLLGALQLRWHTRLAGRIEREQMTQPVELDRAVVAAWRATAEELPGVLAILDHYRDRPTGPEMAAAMSTAVAKERAMLAMMAGRASAADAAAVRVGAGLERDARSTILPRRLVA